MIEDSPFEDPSTEPSPLPLSFYVFVAGMIIVTGAAFALSGGNAAAAIAPGLVLALVWAMFQVRLAYSALAIFAAVLLFHNPGGRPHEGHWEGPLYPLGALLYPNLRLIVNVDALRFNAIELLFVLLLLVVLLRWVVGDRRDIGGEPPAARPMRVAVTVAGVTVFACIAYGLLRGGDFKQMLWQTRQLMWAPILSGIFMRAFRTPGWHRALGWTVLLIAVIRAFDAAYFWNAYVVPQGLNVEYALTHDDSVLFGTVVILVALLVFDRFGKQTILLAMMLAPIIGYALVVNRRRLAYVGIAASLVMVFLALRKEVRARFIKAGLILLPVVVLYVGIGTQSQASIFAPVRSLISVADKKNASNETRDIENYNLISTLRGNPIAGTGFGHEYIEYSRAYDISQWMPNYRYIAHNSVLWLLMLTGAVGFSALWFYYVLGIFYAARIYRVATNRLDAVAALTSGAVIVIYVFQAWGDMGMISWMASFLLAASIAIIANLAARTPGVLTALPEPNAADITAVDAEPLRAEQVA